MIDGQHESKILWVFALAPLLASYVLGLRAMKIATVTALVVLAGVWNSGLWFEVQRVYPESKSDDLILLGASLFFICGLVLSAKKSKERRIEKLKEQGKALEIARREAESASLAKSAFLANMSHEIRTPMNGILGMTEQLRMSTEDPDDARAVAVAHRSGQRLLSILNDVLDLAKIQSGKFRLARECFDLVELLQNVVDRVADIAKERGVSISCHWPEKRAVLWGDSRRVRQIVMSLLDNAIKYAPKSTVTLRCELPDPGEKARAGGAQEVVIVVEDTGPGISLSDQRRIFCEFEQVDHEDRDLFGGTGLGLVLVRYLARQMGGDIAVQSEVSQGSSFRVQMFLAAGDPAAFDATRYRKATEPSFVTQRFTGVVAVVDDAEINRRVARGHLQNLGCEVLECIDGQSALDLLAERSVDLVLMDLRMPEMDGAEATRRLRGGESINSTTPIVALTASDDPEEREACLAAGMNDYLGKPIVIDRLRAVISKYLDPVDEPEAKIDLA